MKLVFLTQEKSVYNSFNKAKYFILDKFFNTPPLTAKSLALREGYGSPAMGSKP